MSGDPWPTHMNPWPAPYTVITPIPKGCICPPTAEQTCKRSDCGRKDVDVSVAPKANP